MTSYLDRPNGFISNSPLNGKKLIPLNDTKEKKGNRQHTIENVVAYEGEIDVKSQRLYIHNGKQYNRSQMTEIIDINVYYFTSLFKGVKSMTIDGFDVSSKIVPKGKRITITKGDITHESITRLEASKIIKCSVQSISNAMDKKPIRGWEIERVG